MFFTAFYEVAFSFVGFVLLIALSLSLWLIRMAWGPPLWWIPNLISGVMWDVDGENLLIWVLCVEHIRF